MSSLVFNWRMNTFSSYLIPIGMAALSLSYTQGSLSAASVTSKLWGSNGELFDPAGVLVGLTDGEFAVLRVFIERPRRVLSREALLAAARGPDSDAYDRAIDVQVSRLRRKLRSGGDEIIRTVRNEGYLFVPRVARA